MRPEGLGKRTVLFLVVVTAFGCSQGSTEQTAVLAAAPSAGSYPGESWSRVSSPEVLGWSSAKLAEARAFSKEINSAAVIVVQDGVIVDEWGDVSEPLNLRSIRKSLLGGLYGTAVAEGKIQLSSTLGELGIDDTAGLTEKEKRATVRDLLTSSSGVYLPGAFEAPSEGRERPARDSRPPGSFFYSNWDFNALGTIYEKQTGEKIFDAFERRIARPLQMQDYSVEKQEYRREDVSTHPAYVFRMSARDLARFGLLYLREGRWQGASLLAPEWVAESTRQQVHAQGPLGYGYLWWFRPAYERWNYDALYALGNGGQFLMVCPARKLVIVHLVDTEPWLALKERLGQVPTGEERARLRDLILAAAPER